MLALVLWWALTLLPGKAEAICPAGCSCYANKTVDCTKKGLTSFPMDIDSQTRELLLQGNLLEEVPPGALDRLPKLKKLALADNPWRCDCSVRYLVLWLHDTPGLERDNATCGTPKFLMRTLIRSLSGLELGTECARLHTVTCWQLAQRDIGLYVLYLLLLLPLGYSYLWYRGGGGRDGARASAARAFRHSQRASQLAAAVAGEDIYEDIDRRVMAAGRF